MVVDDMRRWLEAPGGVLLERYWGGGKFGANGPTYI